MIKKIRTKEEYELDNIIASSAIEGMPLTDEMIANCKAVLEKKVDGRELIQKIIAENKE